MPKFLFLKETVFLRFVFNIFIYYFKLSVFAWVCADARGLGSPEAVVIGGSEQPKASVGTCLP